MRHSSSAHIQVLRRLLPVFSNSCVSLHRFASLSTRTLSSCVIPASATTTTIIPTRPIDNTKPLSRLRQVRLLFLFLRLHEWWLLTKLGGFFFIFWQIHRAFSNSNSTLKMPPIYDKPTTDRYDYIVIGGGSGGSGTSVRGFFVIYPGGVKQYLYSCFRANFRGVLRNMERRSLSWK